MGKKGLSLQVKQSSPRVEVKNDSISSDEHAHIEALSFTNSSVFVDREEDIVFMDYMPKINIPSLLGSYYEWKEEMARKWKVY